MKNKLLAADSGMQRAALWHCVKPTGIIKVYNIMRLNRSLGLSTTIALLRFSLIIVLHSHFYKGTIFPSRRFFTVYIDADGSEGVPA